MLLAVLAFGSVFLLGNIGGGGALGGPTTSVVIAKQSIPLRHQITLADLEVAKASVNGNGSLANVYTNPSDVVNKIAEINITKGALISSDMLAIDLNVVPTGASPAYLPLASGYVAITVPTGEQQGVAGHISLGDYMTVIASSAIQIFVTAGGGPTLSGPVSKTVFTNVRVIGLGAEYMTWFLNNMTVRYTLESYKDYLATPPSQPDSSCPTVLSAGGVSGKQVDARYHFTTLVTGK
ncbi:MAG: hypothetical protein E6I30_08930 [Chloroflexi bacterium]|nr:MAG: hypothetical protein E6I30_08930 [Chloroflexota bacterium]